MNQNNNRRPPKQTDKLPPLVEAKEPTPAPPTPDRVKVQWFENSPAFGYLMVKIGNEATRYIPVAPGPDENHVTIRVSPVMVILKEPDKAQRLQEQAALQHAQMAVWVPPGYNRNRNPL